MSSHCLPESVALKLLDDVSDACVVVDRQTGAIVWQNAAWTALEHSLANLQAALGESTQPSALEQVTSQLGDQSSVPSRQFVTWKAAGIAAFETEIVVNPFLLEGRSCAAVLVLGPKPLFDSSLGEGELAQLDPLTRLPGRAAVEAFVDRLSKSRGAVPDFALLFLDLDGFKAINDQLGHVAGDRVLAEVASRLAGAIRAGDLIARYGGDEFVILVVGIRDRAELKPVVSRLRQATEAPIDYDGGELRLSASIGAALSHEGWQSVADLVAKADRRMYAEKQQTGQAG